MDANMSLSEMGSDVGRSGNGPERRRRRPVRYAPYSSRAERNEERPGWSRER